MYTLQDEDIDAHVHDFQQQTGGDRPLVGSSAKSELSLDFANDLTEEFNDAQVYVLMLFCFYLSNQFYIVTFCSCIIFILFLFLAD